MASRSGSDEFLSPIFTPGRTHPQFSDLPPLATYFNNEHGVVFKLPLYFAEARRLSG